MVWHQKVDWWYRGLALLEGFGIVSASHDMTLKVWGFDGRAISELIGHTAIVYSVATSSSGLIASASEDNSARVWTHDGQCIAHIPHPGMEPLRHLIKALLGSDWVPAPCPWAMGITFSAPLFIDGCSQCYKCMTLICRKLMRVKFGSCRLCVGCDIPSEWGPCDCLLWLCGQSMVNRPWQTRGRGVAEDFWGCHCSQGSRHAPSLCSDSWDPWYEPKHCIRQALSSSVRTSPQQGFLLTLHTQFF